MFYLRFCLLSFWALYLGLQIIRWAIRKFMFPDHCKKLTNNVSAAFKCGNGERFNLTVRADVCDKHEVGEVDTISATDSVNAQIDRLENHVRDIGYKMTNLEAENLKSEKRIFDFFHTSVEKIKNIKKYNMATKSTNESTNHDCCCRSTALTTCTDKNEMFKNVLDAFKKISDELRDSMNRKIDQLKIDIATMQTNNARDHLPRPPAIPIPRTVSAHTEITSPAQSPSTILLAITSHDIGTEAPQPTPAVSATLACPKSSISNETGHQSTCCILQQYGSDVIFNEYSSDDSWSEDENGFISSPSQRPLPPLPKLLDDHDNIFQRSQS